MNGIWMGGFPSSFLKSQKRYKIVQYICLGGFTFDVLLFSLPFWDRQKFSRKRKKRKEKLGWYPPAFEKHFIWFFSPLPSGWGAFDSSIHILRDIYVSIWLVWPVWFTITDLLFILLDTTSPYKGYFPFFCSIYSYSILRMVRSAWANCTSTDGGLEG